MQRYDIFLESPNNLAIILQSKIKFSQRQGKMANFMRYVGQLNVLRWTT